jgi:nucleoside-diphosphate-sugar epimerase
MVSSTAVYANRYTRSPIREADADLTVRLPVDGPNPFHPRLGHAYGNGKREAEQALRDSGVIWTAVRPPVILASDDRTRRAWWFVQRLLDGAPILIPDWGPGRVFQLAWTHDVAHAMSHIVANPIAYGKAYNVAQTEVYTAESWIEACAAQLGVTPRYTHVAEDCPPGYLLPVAGRPFGHMLVDASAIRYDLGFDPSPEGIWLAETIQGCAANAPAEPSPGYEHRAAEIAVARSGS